MDVDYFAHVACVLFIFTLTFIIIYLPSLACRTDDDGRISHADFSACRLAMIINRIGFTY